MSELCNSQGVNITEDAPSGFSFENVQRNAFLMQQFKDPDTAQKFLPKATKTGTTISGMAYKDGVILGADTRATGGTEVADKNCEKIHYLADNIYCCGAGTAADTEKTTELISSQLELLRMNTKSQPRVVAACTLLKRMLFRYQGHISAALVLGGVDVDGPHVYQIYPHGSTSKLPYTTMGSGSLAAMAVYETEWRENMAEADAVKLVQKTILAGIFNDLGSGSSCDICIIRNDGTVEMSRGSITPNDVGPIRSAIHRSNKLNIRPGTTPLLSTTFVPAKVTLADVTVTPMET